MSIGIGSSASALRCISTPTGFCSRTARCAARIERGRPSAIGSTMPGKRTRPRTGTMIRPSAGKAGDAAAAAPPASAEFKRSASVILGSRLLQCHQKAALPIRAMNGAVSPRRQANAAFKTALRQFEAMDDCGPHLGRKLAYPGKDQFAAVERDLSLVKVDSRQRDEHQDG